MLQHIIPITNNNEYRSILNGMACVTVIAAKRIYNKNET